MVLQVLRDPTVKRENRDPRDRLELRGLAVFLVTEERLALLVLLVLLVRLVQMDSRE